MSQYTSIDRRDPKLFHPFNHPTTTPPQNRPPPQTHNIFRTHPPQHQQILKARRPEPPPPPPVAAAAGGGEGAKGDAAEFAEELAFVGEYDAMEEAQVGM
jgi:hypothetical protein